MVKLTTLNVTSFEEKPDSPAYVSFSGTDALGKRTESHQVATPVFLDATRRLMKPALDAVLEEAHAPLAAYIQTLDGLKRQATEAHTLLVRDLKRLFAARSGQTINQQLDGNSAKATVLVSPT